MGIEAITKPLGIFLNSLSSDANLLITLLFFTALLVIYSVFIFYFYKFLAKKNLIELNLDKYNNTEHEGLTKFLAFLFYILEYLIILPIITLFWFAVLAIFLVVLSKTEQVSTILTIAAALVASVRITAYISEDLSRDLSKMIPLALIALFILEPNFFSIELLVGRLNQIPLVLYSIPYYLLFIISIELIVRLTDLIVSVFKYGEPRAEDNEQV